MISDEDKERVRQSTDMAALVGETVVLRQRGSEFWGCCPFHNEKSASFHFNPATGFWKCFGCGKSGDVFAYVMEREHLDFPDAIRYLADRAGIELQESSSVQRGPKRGRLNECLSAAEERFSTMLMRGKGPGPESARRYLASRGFGGDVCRRWKLGYAPGRGDVVRTLSDKGFTRAEMLGCDIAVDRSGRLQDRFYERVMFPIHDEQGRCIGFGGRVMGDAKPKYLNTAETSIFHKSKHMFAFDRAKEHIAATGTAVVVEGYTDVIALHEAGFKNVVATLGTALSLDHVKTLSRFAKTIIFMFDGDAAGQKAADNAIQYLDKTEALLSCVVLPDDLDPADFVSERGPEALKAQLDGARPLMDFVFESRLGRADLGSHGRRVAMLDEMCALLSPLKTSVLLDEYATRLADALGVDVSEVKRRIKSAAPARQAREQDVPPEDDYVPIPDEMPLSSEEAQQVSVERELLALMTAHPESTRAFADRFAPIEWADARDQAIAWAILALPDGTGAADAVRAAEGVVPDAGRLIASGQGMESSSDEPEKAMEFLLDNVEYHSVRRKIRTIRARLNAQVTSEEATALFREATELQKRANQLGDSIASMVEVTKNG